MAGAIWIQLNSDLVFRAGHDPADRAALQATADAFSKRIEHLLAKKTGGTANVHVTNVEIGSVNTVVHEGKLTVEADDKWDNVRRLFEEHNDDIESWIEDEWKRDQRHALQSAKVSVTAGLPPRPNAAASTGGDNKQRQRLARAIWRAYAIAGILTIIAASAWWNYSFMREEIALLRQDIRDRAVPPVAPPQGDRVIVVYPPPAATVPIREVAQVRDRRVRRYSSRGD